MKALCHAAVGLILLTGSALAQEDSHSIAAVVNEEIISTLDVDDRIRFIIGTANLSDTPEVRARLKPQVTRQLIDEKLQLQEAARSGINISTEEVKATIAGMEKQQGRPPGTMEGLLDQKGIPKLTFYNQLRSQLSWNRLVTKKARPRVHVSDDEVMKLREKQASNAGQEEIQFASIVLPVDAPENEESVKNLADKLLAELKGGASFDAVASQFSAQPGESKPVWARAADMEPNVAAALTGIKTGEITPPLRTSDGYLILKRLGERTSGAPLPLPKDDAEVALKQIVLSLKPEASNKEAIVLLDIARAVAKHPGSCGEKTVAGIEGLSDVDMEVSFTRTRISSVSPEVRKLLEGVSVGATTEPFATPKGLQLFMLCEKVDLPVSEDEVTRLLREAIFAEKISLEALKYMRNLRRDAFIEIRNR